MAIYGNTLTCSVSSPYGCDCYCSPFTSSFPVTTTSGCTLTTCRGAFAGQCASGIANALPPYLNFAKGTSGLCGTAQADGYLATCTDNTKASAWSVTYSIVSFHTLILMNCRTLAYYPLTSQCSGTPTTVSGTGNTQCVASGTLSFTVDCSDAFIPLPSVLNLVFTSIVLAWLSV